VTNIITMYSENNVHQMFMKDYYTVIKVSIWYIRYSRYILYNSRCL